MSSKNRFASTLLGSVTVLAALSAGLMSIAVADGPSAGSSGSVLNSPLGLSVEAVDELKLGEQTQINNIELPDHRAVNLRLERFSALAPDASVIAAGPTGERTIDLSDLVLLRGGVVGDDDSRAFISLSDAGVQGFIETAGSVYSISSGLRADGFGRPQDVRVTKVDAPIGGLNLPPVSCGVLPDDPTFHPNGLPRPVEQAELESLERGDAPCRVARLAIETDWEYTAQLFSGDADAAAAYAISLIAGVSEIYESNVNVRFVVGYLRLWESNSDPYNQGDDLLQEFRLHWNATQSGVERDLAHLLSGRNDLPYGGVAYLSVLCSSNYGYGLSGYLNGSFPYPLINNNGGNWDLVVVAHELGHNFGTGHTHDSYSPPIDNCGNGNCAGAGDGTIMSYCHTCPGGISNITLNFHPLVRSRILSYLNSACDLTANGAVAVDDLTATLPDEPVVVDILLNDLASSCDTVSLEEVDALSQAGGVIEVLVNLGGNGRDRVRYTPPSGYSGLDSFSYTIAGGAQATVEVDVLDLRQPDGAGAFVLGVDAEFFELNDPVVLPDFDLLSPYESGEFDLVNFASTNGEFAGSGRSDNVGAVFSGYIDVPTPGLYTLYTESDDGSRLLIGEEMIVENDGLHGMQERSGTIALAPGKHAVRVEFFERGGGAGLIVRFEGPGLSKRVVEAFRWFRPAGCPADVSQDGQIDLSDLNIVLANFGQTSTTGDANEDGAVDLADLNLILSQFGALCE